MRTAPVGKVPVDILGPLYYAIHPKQKAIRFEHGHVFVPDGPGLGLEIHEGEIIELAGSGAV